MNQNHLQDACTGDFLQRAWRTCWESWFSAEGVNLAYSCKRCVLLTLDAWSRILFMGDPQSSVYFFEYMFADRATAIHFSRATAWGLTIWGLGRTGITAIGLKGKSGCRQVDAEVNIAVLVSWRSHQGLGHNTLRLLVQAVYFCFILPGCQGVDCADLHVVPCWDVMWCGGALTEIQDSRITKAENSHFLLPKRCLQITPCPYCWSCDNIQKSIQNSLIQKDQQETYFCTSYLGHRSHTDDSGFLSLFQPQEQTPEPRIPHLVDKWSVSLPFRYILSAVNCCITTDLFCTIASMWANSSRGRIWVLSKYVLELLNLHFSRSG